jgi:hypothetical protein
MAYEESSDLSHLLQSNTCTAACVRRKELSSEEIPKPSNLPARAVDKVSEQSRESITASIQALYEEQQKIYTGAFKNKRGQIEKQYNEFRSHKSADDDVAAYLYQTAGHVYDTLPKWAQPKNVFTNPPNTRLAENKDYYIIGNRASFDIAQYQDSPQMAGMSMIHLLALPKARIYNGVSLTRENVSILESMIKLFQASWPKKAFRQAVLDHQRLAIEQRYQSKSNPNISDILGYHLAL